MGANNYSDEMAVRLHNEATQTFDADLDGIKMGSTNQAMPYIAAAMPDMDYSINSIPDFDKNYDIPVRVKVGVAGNYTFNFKGISNFNDISCLLFEDTYTGIITNLKTDSMYNCFLSDTAISPRFYLRTRAALPASAVATTCSYNNDGKLIVNNPNQKVQHLAVSKLNGQEIAQNQSADNTIEFGNLSAGKYVVSYLGLNTLCGVITDTLEVIAGVEVTASFELASDTIYLVEGNGLVILNNSSNALEYQWSVGNLQSQEVTPDFNITQPGIQTITLSAINNACTDILTKEINVLAKRAADGNPTLSNTINGAMLNFDFINATEVQINIYTALGQAVKSPVNMEVQQQNYLIDLSEQAAGVYFVDVIYNNQKVTFKVQY